MYAYLGVTPDGSYQLCVSTAVLNPVGPRLERGPQRRLPEAIITHAEKPGDGTIALAALKSLQGFFDGKEYGPGAPEFGQPLPTRRSRRSE